MKISQRYGSMRWKNEIVLVLVLTGAFFTGCAVARRATVDRQEHHQPPAAPQRMTQPAIVTAAEKGDLEAVTQELAKGSDVNARDEFGNTPVMLAAQRGHPDIVRFLVDKGADINARNNNNLDALAFLALYQEYGSALGLGGTQFKGFGVTLPGHLAAAEYLIDKGLDVNAKVGKAGWSTALLQAVGLDKAELVELLLRKGTNPGIANDKGATPLMLAAYRGNKRIVELLLSKGVEINAREVQGRTALDLAGTDEVKHLLLQRGAKSGQAAR